MSFPAFPGRVGAEDFHGIARGGRPSYDEGRSAWCGAEVRKNLVRSGRSMAKTSDYLALDLGAESGRGLLGRFDGERLTLDEVHRFANGPVRMLDTLHWDLLR